MTRYLNTAPRAGMLLLLLATAACNGQSVGQTLGFGRDAPDEFTVVSRPSLSVPPDFTLRPPKPGAPPLAPKADEAARGIVLGKKPEDWALHPDGGAISPAERSFLNRSGADRADGQIRDKLMEDEARPIDTSAAGSLYEKVTGKDKSEPVVDAKKESERLRKNKDEGKPANEGEVPIEKPAKPALIDAIF